MPANKSGMAVNRFVRHTLTTCDDIHDMWRVTHYRGEVSHKWTMNRTLVKLLAQWETIKATMINMVSYSDTFRMNEMIERIEKAFQSTKWQEQRGAIKNDLVILLIRSWPEPPPRIVQVPQPPHVAVDVKDLIEIIKDNEGFALIGRKAVEVFAQKGEAPLSFVLSEVIKANSK